MFWDESRRGPGRAVGSSTIRLQSGGSFGGAGRDLGAATGRASSILEQVLVLLREAIVNGDIPPGTPLRDAPIAESVGTGRGVVREAIRQLVQEGLAGHERYRGAFVRVMSLADAVDIYTTRIVIATGAARQVLDSPQPPDVTRLEAALGRVCAAATGDARPSEELIVSDVGFHQELVRLAGGPRLTGIYETLMLHPHHPPYPAVVYADSHHPSGAAHAGRPRPRAHRRAPPAVGAADRRSA